MARILDGGTAWRIHEGARSALLVDGRDYFAAFYAAASTAQRSVCLLGWQFDSDVRLLRGTDVPPGTPTEDLALLPFLDGLCRARPELEVRVLAWDHSVVFTFEREPLQKLLFDVATCDRFTFRWDATVPLGGSHHQKVAIVDGRMAFVGSQDLCHSRWDDSSHRVQNPDRASRFELRYKPYHEVQAAVTGAPARSLLDLFVDRWRGATGEELDPRALVHAPGPHADAIDVAVTLPMAPATIGIARTIPEDADAHREHVSEIDALFVRAIRGAERLVYIETQYLTSRAIRDALVERMAAASRPELDVVIMLPRRPEALKEELTISLPQQELLATLESTAAAHGHRLGVYNVRSPAPTADSARGAFVYIHAKLMIVDDRFMTVGSANLTNRSMTIDSEANLAWEASSGDRPVRCAIRQARTRLLLEHVGERARVRDVVASRGLADRLEALAAAGTTRLRRHAIRSEEPGVLARKVQELACEMLDPRQGAEEVRTGPISRPSGVSG